MADLGSVGKLYGGLNDYKPKRLPANFWNIRSVNLYTSYGSLSGIVKRKGVTVANVWVRLYYRPTGALIAQTKTGNDGTFSFSPSNDTPIGLDTSDLNNYYCLAIDNQDLTNVTICDLLTAV